MKSFAALILTLAFAAQAAGLPLHHAAITGDTDAIAAQLSAGADPNVQNVAGETALHWAALRGYTEVIIALLDAGADLNVQNVAGETALHWAALRGYTEAIIVLLSAGADPNTKANNGMRPLHSAASKCHTEAMIALLNGGADPDVQDGMGRTPSRMADDRCRTAARDVLARAEAELAEFRARAGAEAEVRARAEAEVGQAEVEWVDIDCDLARGSLMGIGWYYCENDDEKLYFAAPMTLLAMRNGNFLFPQGIEIACEPSSREVSAGPILVVRWFVSDIKLPTGRIKVSVRVMKHSIVFNHGRARNSFKYGPVRSFEGEARIDSTYALRMHETIISDPHSVLSFLSMVTHCCPNKAIEHSYNILF